MQYIMVISLYGTSTLAAGIPYLADLSNQPLYIFNNLFILLPASIAMNMTIILHYLLSAIFMYLLVIHLTNNKYIGIFGAISFAFSGYCVSLSCNLEYLTSIIWIPATLWSFYKAINTNKTIYLFLTAIFLSMFIFGGEPMAIYYLILFMFIRCLFEYKDNKELKKYLIFLFIRRYRNSNIIINTVITGDRAIFII